MSDHINPKMSFKFPFTMSTFPRKKERKKKVTFLISHLKLVGFNIVVFKFTNLCHFFLKIYNKALMIARV